MIDVVEFSFFYTFLQWSFLFFLSFSIEEMII